MGEQSEKSASADRSGPQISVVLATFDRKPFLKACIKRIRNELSLLDCGGEIVVIDGGSTDGTLQWLCKQSDIITVVQHNRQWRNNTPHRKESWGYFINLGFKIARGEIVCMISDDVLLLPGAIKSGLVMFSNDEVTKPPLGGVAFYYREWPTAGPYFVYKLFGRLIQINHGLFRRAALEKVGYVDQVNYSFYRADNDLCLRLEEAGYRIEASEGSFVEHYANAAARIRATNVQTLEADSQRLYQRWSTHYRTEDNPRRFYDRVEREYVDPSRTHLEFPAAITRFISSLRRVVMAGVRKL